MNDPKTTAVALIDKYTAGGALTYVSREDCMAVTPLYKPEVTVIQLRLPNGKDDPNSDVYNIQGKYMPKREIVDRIGEATGLIFIHDGCRTWTETYNDEIAGKRTVYISEQQAKKRMSDGSWRTSSVQAYEFDPVMRAMIDFGVTELNAQTKQQKDRWGKKTLAQTILEYTKVARQRAETGARLRVIRELTNMPTAFSAADAAKPLVFGRFAQNTDYILQTPEGRAMASAQALGVDVASLFGGRRVPPAEAQAAEAESVPAAVTSGEPQSALPGSTADYTETDAGDAFGDAPDFPPATESAPRADTAALAEQAAGAGESEFDALTQSLEQWVETYKDRLNVTFKSGMNPYNIAMAELDANNFNATVETRKAMIQRIKDFLKTNGVNV